MKINVALPKPDVIMESAILVVKPKKNDIKMIIWWVDNDWLLRRYTCIDPKSFSTSAGRTLSVGIFDERIKDVLSRTKEEDLPGLLRTDPPAALHMFFAAHLNKPYSDMLIDLQNSISRSCGAGFGVGNDDLKPKIKKTKKKKDEELKSEKSKGHSIDEGYKVPNSTYGEASAIRDQEYEASEEITRELVERSARRIASFGGIIEMRSDGSRFTVAYDFVPGVVHSERRFIAQHMAKDLIRYTRRYINEAPPLSARHLTARVEDYIPTNMIVNNDAILIDFVHP